MKNYTQNQCAYKAFKIYLLLCVIMFTTVLVPIKMFAQTTTGLYGRCGYGIGAYGIGGTCAVGLPIKNIVLTGSYSVNNYPNLNYTIQTTYDLERAEIYVSTDGINYALQNINKQVDNTVNKKSYAFIDTANANAGKLYYKIKAYDLANNFMYSNVVVLNNKTQLKEALHTKITIMLYANSGNLVLQKQIEKTNATEKIDVTNLTSGIYNLIIVTNNNKESFEVNIQH
jgi:hypothetical protein